MSNRDALPEAGTILNAVILASNSDEAYAKARLDARAFFGEGRIQVHLVEAEVETPSRNARGEPITGPVFTCRFHAWLDDEEPIKLSVVRLEDVAIALIDSRTSYQLADNFTPNQSQMHDAASLVSALERRGYQIVRKDGE